MADEVYKRFDELREAKGISVYAVSKATGIKTTTFTNWKNGKYTPKDEKLQLIANYFGVTVSYLRSGEKENAPSSLTPTEYVNLISMYSKLSDEQKNAIKIIISSMISK